MAGVPESGNALLLPTDYDQIFGGRTLLITGVSRGGTSILAKLLGSLEDVVYVHEPVVLRFVPTLAAMGRLDFGLASQMLKGLLFEDYFLQVLQGRHLNLNKDENSYSGHYETMAAVKARRARYPRRGDVLRDVAAGRFYTFLTKITDVQPLLPLLGRVFPGLRVIQIVRNGSEIISSSAQQGWYTDEYFNRSLVQWMQPASANAPWYVPADMVEQFSRWNRETRAAYIWRTLVEEGRAYARGRADCLELRYEDLVTDPEQVLSRCEAFVGAGRSRLTRRHLRAVQEHRVTAHQDQRLCIEPGERERFERTMLELGYRSAARS